MSVDTTTAVLSVLGPVPAQELGATLISESLLSVMPGAELAPEIVIDRASLYNELRQCLIEFRELGGGTIVDRGGMTMGRDLAMYELLSKETGVHIVASTGFGPEWSVGTHFTSPTTLFLDPPTALSADHVATLFAREVTEGMVVPPRKRVASAGIISVAADDAGITEFEELVFRAAARAALQTGVSVSVQVGPDALAETEILLSEGLPPARVIVSGADRLDIAAGDEWRLLADRGMVIALDHIGWSEATGYVDNARRAEMVVELFNGSLGDRVVVSSNSVGAAIGFDAPTAGFAAVLGDFVPTVREAGATDAQIKTLMEENPQRLLAVEVA
jgi:phosphotriesterase-related protein